MKKIYVVLFLILGLSLSNCSNSDIIVPQILDTEESEQMLSWKISKDNALEIANKVLGVTLYGTRTGADCSPSFDYVLKKETTRGNAALPDTLAYVINYPDNKGFVIVSSLRNVYPVLGYSYDGNFSFDNEIVKDNFISNIDTYLQSKKTDTPYEVTDDDFDNCYFVNPVVQISLSQRAPWNKYVIEEHPGCPVGCVAVATALVMCYSNTTLTYHGSVFHLKSMRKAIKERQDSLGITNNTPSFGEDDDLLQPIYTYEQAVDSMAKLLYWIGKDVNMHYATGGSGAVSKDAYDLCSSLDFNIPSNYADYSIEDICWYLKDEHIIYVRGRDYDKNAGHAWVCDGCRFCVKTIGGKNIDIAFFHCDWGWGGSCNGYFNPEVFEVANYKFTPLNYFAVRYGKYSLKPSI